MLRSKRLALYVLTVTAVAVVGLWTTAAKPPRLPADRDHGFEQAETRCLQCHVHTGAHPRPTDHPLRDDCFSCHRDAHGGLHPRPGAPLSVPGGWQDDPRLAGKLGGRGKRP
ncbi:MAG: hypothetical protein LAO05_15395 [Acidobacteriia bacterium]|nr:hypothetical protein [Terriglobia bacterium]